MVKRVDYMFLLQFYQDFSRKFINAVNFVQDAMRTKPSAHMINTSGIGGDSRSMI